MASATSLLFNSSLTYVPPTRSENVPGHSRDDTALITLLLQEQKQTKTRMETLMMVMKRIQHRNEIRRIVLEEQRLALEQEKVRLDHEFRMTQLQMQHGHVNEMNV
ncbi:hypothetical protein Ocin01_20164 [Orchesella cincta]|uniref:Uncharacterized protein n=1 Tax=Orchesella cincta TaxID=48709 RepID=A0A1D2M0M5_ORCCI|nr:hypothetical protein Ocin01_20164 [Orchesella cincta]